MLTSHVTIAHPSWLTPTASSAASPDFHRSVFRICIAPPIRHHPNTFIFISIPNLRAQVPPFDIVTKLPGGGYTTSHDPVTKWLPFKRIRNCTRVSSRETALCGVPFPPLLRQPRPDILRADILKSLLFTAIYRRQSPLGDASLACRASAVLRPHQTWLQQLARDEHPTRTACELNK